MPRSPVAGAGRQEDDLLPLLDDLPRFNHGEHWDYLHVSLDLDTPGARLSFPCAFVSLLSTFEDWVVHCMLCSDAILFRSFAGVITVAKMPPDKAGLLHQELRAARRHPQDVICLSCQFGDLDCAALTVPIQVTSCPAPHAKDEELFRTGVPWNLLPMNLRGGRCANHPCHRRGKSKCVPCWAQGLRIYYCSLECQKAHWESGHKLECGKPNLGDHAGKEPLSLRRTLC